MSRPSHHRLPIAALVAALSPLALSVSSAQPPAKRPITFADLMALKRVSDPQISPSGQWVLFSVTDVSLAANTKINHLWLVPLDAAKPEIQLTTGKGETNGRFSPDGHHISYTADDPEGASQIVLADWNETTGAIANPTQLTHLSTGADGAIWSPDGQHLLLTSSVYPDCSTIEGVRAAKAAAASPEAALAQKLRGEGQPGRPGQISPMVTANLGVPGQPAGRGENLEPAPWSDEAACNQQKDEAAAKDPVKAQVWDALLYRHWNQYTGQKRSHILLVSATHGDQVRDLTPASNVGTAETPTFSLGGPLGYAWSPDSKEIAYVTNLDQVPATSTNNDIFTLALDNAADNQQSVTATKPKKISTSPGSDDGPQYSPDGKYLAFRSQARNGFESDRFRLMFYDRAQRIIGEVIPRFRNPAGKPFDGWIDEFAWTGDSAALLFTSPWRGQEAIFCVNATFPDSTQSNPVFIQMTDFGEYGDIRAITSKDGSETRIIAAKMSASEPGELVSISSKMLGHTFYGTLYGAGYEPEIEPSILSATPISHLNQDEVSRLDLSKLESFWFPGANGTKVEGFLLRPPNFDPQKKYPLKFLMHGGPQTAWGDSWSYRWNWQLMAASGYVVIGINRRGSTGYGQQFVDEVSGDWGGRAYQDLMLGLNYAETKFPFIDKTRECALGASYGGFMADWVLTHTDRFKCIVTHDGLSDPASAFGTTEELWFPEWEFRPLATKPGSQNAHAVVEQAKPSYPWDFYNKPANQDPYRRWSPMQFIENAKTPTLVIHSQRDYRLDVSQGLELFTALQLRGIPSKFLYFPDEGHWVLKPQNSELWNATVSDWCDRWTHTNQYAEAAPTRPPAKPETAP